MTFGTVVAILFGLTVAALTLMVFWRYRAVLRAAGSPGGRSQDATRAEAATVGSGERTASPAAEQIEEMARARLAEHPDLAQVQLDFGTAPDGTLEVWLDGERYASLEDIPDARIRAAVKDAVADFNR